MHGGLSGKCRQEASLGERKRELSQGWSDFKEGCAELDRRLRSLEYRYSRCLLEDAESERPSPEAVAAVMEDPESGNRRPTVTHGSTFTLADAPKKSDRPSACSFGSASTPMGMGNRSATDSWTASARPSDRRSDLCDALLDDRDVLNDAKNEVKLENQKRRKIKAQQVRAHLEHHLIEQQNKYRQRFRRSITGSQLSLQQELDQVPGPVAKAWSAVMGGHAHKNTRFNASLKLSFRGAMWVLILGAPFTVSLDQLTWLSEENRERAAAIGMLFTPKIVMYVIYCLQPTVGATMEQIWYGIAGVLAGVFWVRFMFFCYPHGVTPESDWSMSAIGILLGIFFLVALHFLDCPVVAVVYGSSFFVYWWMDFMQPGGHTASAAMTDTMTELAGCFLGSFCCFLATAIPYPLFAITRAQKEAKVIGMNLTSSWEIFLEYYFSTHETDADVQAQQLRSKVFAIRQERAYFDVLIANSWFEVASKSTKKWTFSRVALQRLSHMFKESNHRLQFAETMCHDEALRMENKDKLASTRDACKLLNLASTFLLDQCIEAILDGDVTNQEAFHLEELHEEVEVAMIVLAEVFIEHRNQDAADTTQKQQLKQTINEHIFVYEIFTFARLICNYAEFVLSERTDAKDLPAHSFKDVCHMIRHHVAKPFNRQVIFTKEHLTVATRNLLAIVGTFIIGWRGVSIVERYNAGLSGICSLVINKSGGSMLDKLRARIFGVVIGTAVGQLIHSMFAWCSFSYLVPMWLTMAVLVFFAFLVYFQSTTAANQYVGYLIAFFSATNIIQPCSDVSSDKSVFYTTVANVVLATGALFAIDSVVNSTRSADMAWLDAKKAFRKLSEAFKDFCEPDNPMRLRHDEIVQLILSAKNHGEDAHQEPRYFRQDWDFLVFDRIITTCRRVSTTLTSTGFCLTGNHDFDNCPKKVFVIQVMRTDAFREIRDMMFKQMENLGTLLERYEEITEKEGADPRESLACDPKFRWLATINKDKKRFKQLHREFAAEVLELVGRLEVTEDSLEEDKTTKACVVIGSLELSYNALHNLQLSLMGGGVGSKY